MQTELQERLVSHRSPLDWLDGLSPWKFTAVLYVLRWVVIFPLDFILSGWGVGSHSVRLQGSPGTLFLEMVVLNQIVETFVECTLPYWLMSPLRLIRVTKRAWGFVIVSGLVMAALHFDFGPSAIIFGFVTGCFLAYTYAHFARRGFWPAFWYTCVFHAGINIIGWLMFVST